MTKHDFENSLVTIRSLSKSVEPAINAMIQYLSESEAYHVVSKSQMKIVARAMQAIINEADSLERLTRSIEFPDKEKKND